MHQIWLLVSLIYSEPDRETGEAGKRVRLENFQAVRVERLTCVLLPSIPYE